MEPAILTKGGNASLTKLAADAGSVLSNVTIGLGWDANPGSGAAYDLDALVFGLGADDKVIPGWFVYFNNLRSPDGSVVHDGDNLTGEGEGDDERVHVNLPAVPDTIKKMVVAVAIFEAEQRGNQNFGSVTDAFVRIMDDNTNQDLVRYDLTEDYSLEAAVAFIELYRHEGGWKARALGKGYANLATVCAHYGVS